ncbi:helicase-associated domain-containing protein [Jatrophihabitans endophyticus]|uniref:helicase-associated domain-containing protein n=1 Tax=Jatrophihabitans endophyticus TaxID=1206085 RepID=UPI0019FEB63A|nr:helicase-associated domain-containing protein [Jatrophihabitans endophyticus]MBE7187533.1 helicase-associated domain-containing protein [Jatrophihabitans endophyticus]
MSSSAGVANEGVAPRATSLTAWLRARDDRALARLLQLRPDLALPAAPDIASLAGRVGVRTSVQRAIDALDAYTLRVLAHLVLAAGGDDVVDSVLPDDAEPALEALFDRALIWGESDRVHLTPGVRETLGPYPAGLGRRAAALLALAPEPGAAQLARSLEDPAWVAAQLDELDEDERELVEILAGDRPVAQLTLGDGPASAARRVLARGLLVPIDSGRVELPREVGLAVRGRAARDDDRRPPDMELVEREPADLDRLGTTAVLESLRLTVALAESWSAQPPPVLRSGGIGVRELKRTAKDLAVDEATAALLAEVALAAGLIYTTSAPQPVYLPTPEFDEWREQPSSHRWSALAGAWLGMTRQPSLVGQRGERDRVISALGPDVERGTVPALRRRLLELLAGLAPGAAPRDRHEVLDRLTWQQPRRASSLRPLAEVLLHEADVFGLTAAGGITGYTRTLIGGSTSAAQHALDQALPAPVDHFLVQPDLTVVVPGPPDAALGIELDLFADLESSGGAAVYRITEQSVRRALDAGRTGAGLTAFVAERSRTPVPQALSYLIDDAARRHGRLRVGAASAYLRCDDETLVSRVVADRSLAGLELRRLAPNVLVASAPITQVLDALRRAGLAPAAESPDGELITLGSEPPRAPSRPAARLVRSHGVADSEAQTAEIVRRIRSGDALAGMDTRVQSIAREVPGVTSASTMELLRTAVREARLVWFGCAEADGRTTAHTMQPISLAAGTLRGYERGRSGLAAYPVHRITSIRLLDEDDDLP